jgi:hypothetical protein
MSLQASAMLDTRASPAMLEKIFSEQNLQRAALAARCNTADKTGHVAQKDQP